MVRLLDLRHGSGAGETSQAMDWIGDPANKTLEVLTLKEDRYELHCCVEEKGKLTSLVLVGLECDLAEIP